MRLLSKNQQSMKANVLMFPVWSLGVKYPRCDIWTRISIKVSQDRDIIQITLLYHFFNRAISYLALQRVLGCLNQRRVKTLRRHPN